MAPHCLTWIPCLWGSLLDSFISPREDVPTLPDDVVVEIISRLPAECVLRCRMVCKQWKALTSTPYFVQLHLKRATAVRCLQYGQNLFLFDEDGDEDSVIKAMRMWSRHWIWKVCPVLIGSCDGLLLFRPLLGGKFFYICNPVTQEELGVKGTVPCYACGFFFHSFTKEYTLLFACQCKDEFEYVIYSLGSKSSRRITTLAYRPAAHSFIPAIVNGALHWMVEHNFENEFDIPPCSNSIMTFNMKSEDFRFMPHPGEECSLRHKHGQMHLLETNEQLSLCYLCDRLVDIWVLEDYANWCWVRRYTVRLDWSPRRYPFTSQKKNNHIRILKFQNDELLLDWHSRGIFRYHLKQHTITRIGRKGGKAIEQYCYSGESASCTKSLVSLNHFAGAIKK